MAISLPHWQVSSGSTANPASRSLGTTGNKALAYSLLGPCEGMKMPVQYCPRWVGKHQFPWALCQFWGHTIWCHAELCSSRAGSAQPPSVWESAWAISSKHPCSPSWQWSQPILWSFQFYALKISSCMSQMGNVRCSWCSVSPVYNYCKLCWMGNVFIFAALGCLADGPLTSSWELKQCMWLCCPILLKIVNERRAGKHPSAWAVSPETSLLAHTSCPSSDSPEQACYCGAILFTRSSLYDRLPHFLLKKTSASSRIKSEDTRGIHCT